MKWVLAKKQIPPINPCQGKPLPFPGSCFPLKEEALQGAGRVLGILVLLVILVVSEIGAIRDPESESEFF